MAKDDVDLKHELEVLWAMAPDSKLARKEIARKTGKHKDTTPKGRLKRGK